MISYVIRIIHAKMHESLVLVFIHINCEVLYVQSCVLSACNDCHRLSHGCKLVSYYLHAGN